MGLTADSTFTVLFLVMFLCFLYLYGTSTENENAIVFSPTLLKGAMWLSAFMAAVAHLSPKKIRKDEDEDLTKPRVKEYYKINERVKQSIMNAIRLDE